MADEPPLIPEEELHWTFARSGGPGGQNVNKVASKATLSWEFARSSAISATARARLPLLYPRYMIGDGWLQITSQKTRDQERNKQDCLEKLQLIIAEAGKLPKARRATRPTRGSKLRRLTAKKLRGDVKAGRRAPRED